MKLAVVVTPKAGRDKVVGFVDGPDGRRELSVHVAAVPEKGKATKAVCDLVAKQLKVPKSAVECTRGGASRHKQLEIDCDEATLSSWLAQYE